MFCLDNPLSHHNPLFHQSELQVLTFQFSSSLTSCVAASSTDTLPLEVLVTSTKFWQMTMAFWVSSSAFLLSMD